MNNTDEHNEMDESDLEGFETPEEDFDAGMEAHDGAPEEIVDDADFQDVDDDLDADVFGEEQPAEPAPKKKVNWFNIVVAVVAVAVAGGLIWSKLGPQIMGGGDSIQQIASSPINPVSAPVSKADSQVAAQAAVGGPAGGAGVGLLDNPDQFATLNQMPAPDTPTPATEVGGDPFAALGNAAPSVPMPAPISGTPVTAPATIKDETPAPAEPVKVAEIKSEPVPAPVAATQSPASEDTGTLKAQVSALEQKMEALDSKISAAVEQMSNMGNMQAASAPVDDARLSGIQKTLERLESRIDDLSKKGVTRAASVPAYTDDTPAPKKTPAKTKKSTMSSKPKATSATKWDEPYTPPAAAQPVSTGAGGWEMRGAQTGRAVIAKGGDLREVAVGETVPGLGEITGIANIGGRWVVQGTQGRLAQ